VLAVAKVLDTGDNGVFKFLRQEGLLMPIMCRIGSIIGVDHFGRWKGSPTIN
jgi:hypothetical protein